MKLKNIWLSGLISIITLSAFQVNASSKDSSLKNFVNSSNTQKIDLKLSPKSQNISTQTKAESKPWVSLFSNNVMFLPRGLISLLYGTSKAPTTPKEPVLPTDPRELCNYYLRNGTNFESKVSACPQLALQIVWQQPDGRKISYNEWTRVQKDRINTIYEGLNRGDADLRLNCTNPQDGVNSANLRLYITPTEAFDMYAASVAQSIYLEVNHLVPWSLFDNAVEENQAILDSSQFFSIITVTGDEASASAIRRRFLPGTAYQSPAWQHDSKSLLSCDPRIPYLFLNGTYSSTRANILGANQIDTLKNISWWFHTNVAHLNPHEPTPSEYPEWIRTRVFLKDRLVSRPFTNISVSSTGTISTHAVDVPMGCHSAGNLFLELARGVNIPIRLFWYSSNGAPTGPFGYAHHMGIGYHWTQADTKLVLHADDLYVQFKDIFPLTEDSHVMTSNAIKNYFFQLMWQSPEELETWGLHYFRGLPLLLPGQDINRTLPVVATSTPDNGYYAGYSNIRYEERNERGDITFTDYGVGSTVTFFQKSYELCGWSSYIYDYCRDTNPSHLRFYGQIYSIVNSYFARLSQPLPINISVDEHITRVEQCIEANGGCNAMMRAIDTSIMAHGQNSLVLPTTP